jgi:hypothetical protein
MWAMIALSSLCTLIPLYCIIPNSVACILVPPEDKTLAGDGVGSIEKYYKSLCNLIRSSEAVSHDILSTCYDL